MSGSHIGDTYKDPKKHFYDRSGSISKSNRMIDWEEAKRFLEIIWDVPHPEARYIEIGILTDRFKVNQFDTQEGGYIEAIRKALEWIKGFSTNEAHIFYGVLPRKERADPGRRGQSKDVSVGGWLWADLDFKYPTNEPLSECIEGEDYALTCVYEENGKRIKVDRPPLTRILEKLKALGLEPSIVVDSGAGYHLYFGIDSPIEAPQLGKLERALLEKLKKNGLPADLQSRDLARMLRLPGSINPRVNRRVKVIYQSGKTYDPQYLFNVLRKDKQEPLSRSFDRSGKKELELSPRQIREIVNLLEPYYVKGHRNNIVMYLLGALVKNGYSEESARNLIETLGKELGDEEIKKRLYDVKYHYEKRIRERSLSELKGYSGLREEIIDILIERGEDKETAEDEAVQVINKLGEILGFPLERKLILVPRKTGDVYVAFCNDPKRGILLLKKRQGRITREYILGYYIDKVIVHENPYDEKDQVYTVVFKHPKIGKTLVYEEYETNMIASNLENVQYGVRDSRNLKTAISTIIEGFVVRGLAETRNKIPATGFFEIDGKLVWFESSRLKVKLPPVDKEKTIDALGKLEELLKFYRFSDKALAGLYYKIQAPLGFIRKTYARENKILLHYGHPHVGKTLLEKIGAYIWGLDIEKAIIGASNITPPQLATHLNKTTLPITLDEATNILSNQAIVDMLKNSTTNIHIKERIRPQKGYIKEEFYAYASLTITMNYLGYSLPPGINERLIPVLWTTEDKRPEEEVRTFEDNLNKYRENLAYIGSYLRDMFIRRWDEVKEIIKEEDQIKVGMKLLEMLYEDLGIEKPTWIREPKIDYETIDPIEATKDVFFDFIRESLIDALNKARSLVNIESIGPYWDDILKTLAKHNALPSYMMMGEKNVYIKVSVLDEIRRKKGVEIPGGLRNLAIILGYKYETKNGVRALWIPIQDLVENLGQQVSD